MTTKPKHLVWIVAGLLLSLFIAAMDQTVVSTSLGTIIADLGGMDQYVWVTIAYLLTELALMPIYGKLSDMYGRKLFFVFGIGMFLAGSVFCGIATNISELIFFRALQGIGGGALIPIAYTMIYSIIPLEKRGSIGGLFGAAFGLASIFGPMIGSYITEYMSWHWVFYINLIPGIVSLALILMFYHESHVRIKQKIDFLGASTLILAIVSGILALELGGSKYPWNSGAIISLFLVCGVLLCAFLFVETKAADPIIPLKLFTNRLFATSCGLAFLYGSAYVVFVFYIPMFVQGVLGHAATNSGLILTPLLVSSILGSMSGSFSIKNITGYRYTMLFSAIILVIGSILSRMLSVNTTQLEVTMLMIVIGIAVGFSFSVPTIGVNQSVEMSNRGTANATLDFLRSAGMLIGVAVYGSMQENMFTSKIREISGSRNEGHLKGIDLNAMLTPETRAQIPHDILNPLSGALSYSLSHMFMWILVPSVVIMAAAILMPNEKMLVGKHVKSDGATNHFD